MDEALIRNGTAVDNAQRCRWRTRERGTIDNHHPGLLIIHFTLHWRLLIADSTPNGEVPNGFQPESRLIRSSSSRHDIEPAGQDRAHAGTGGSPTPVLINQGGPVPLRDSGMPRSCGGSRTVLPRTHTARTVPCHFASSHFAAPLASPSTSTRCSGAFHSSPAIPRSPPFGSKLTIFKGIYPVD